MQVNWEKQMSGIVPSRELLNKAVLNYLVVEGFKDAALKFQQESGTATGQLDAELIDKRVAIRQRLEAGDVESAIETIRQAD